MVSIGCTRKWLYAWSSLEENHDLPEPTSSCRSCRSDLRLGPIASILSGFLPEEQFPYPLPYDQIWQQMVPLFWESRQVPAQRKTETCFLTKPIVRPPPILWEVQDCTLEYCVSQGHPWTFLSADHCTPNICKRNSLKIISMHWRYNDNTKANRTRN